MQNALEKHFNKKTPWEWRTGKQTFFLEISKLQKCIPDFWESVFSIWSVAEVVECMNSAHNPWVPSK